ncbi:hypothetical protein [Streptomyces cadmiisoli]|uniref:hypothetical protein n=1 Tax=Streptomyces cadmiisoli TaxID=2184053 RepID=UPI0013A6F7B8|nr:hypothetical protein [Streptomyces cadmiisoli]
MTSTPFPDSPVASPGARPRVGPRLVPAVALTAFLTLALAVVTAPAASAAGRVTMTPGTADPQYATKIRLHGSGFQSVKNGFGGVYVLFGTVSGDWRPSQGGKSGEDYVYVQDSETKDNRGYQRFVAFPGDPTAYAANGGTLKADGTWDATLVIPGAVFPAKGRDGSIRQIDCRKVQCGVITIGAHGVSNAGNESFTPVDFAVPDGSAPATKAAPATSAPAVKQSDETKAPTSAGSSAPNTSSAASESAAAPPKATSDPSAPVAADPVVSASSASVPGRAPAIGAAVAFGTVVLWLLLRRRKRRGATTRIKEETA